MRDAASVAALRKALLDGTVDCIATHHLPHEFDSKVVEFEYARTGTTGLETAYSRHTYTLAPELSAEKTVDLFSRRARELFGLGQPVIAEGQPASLSLFDPAGRMQLEENTTRSKSKNSPFIGKELKGRVLGILNGGKIALHSPGITSSRCQQLESDPSPSLLYGSIASICLIALTFGTYKGGAQAFLGWIGTFMKYPILIAFAIAAALVEKKQNGGYLEFRAALKTCFSIFVLALTIQTLFAWLLLNVIDPHFKQLLLEGIPIRMVEAYRQLGVSEDQLNQALADQKGTDPFTFGRMFQGNRDTIIILHFLDRRTDRGDHSQKRDRSSPQTIESVTGDAQPGSGSGNLKTKTGS